MNLNSVTLAGFITQPPVISQTTTGKPVAKFTLAINERQETATVTNYIDIKAYGGTAQYVENHLAKGRNIFIQGRLVQERWQDKKTGAPRTRHTILALSIQTLDTQPRTRDYSEPTTPPTNTETTEDIPW